MTPKTMNESVMTPKSLYPALYLLYLPVDP